MSVVKVSNLIMIDFFREYLLNTFPQVIHIEFGVGWYTSGL